MYVGMTLRSISFSSSTLSRFICVEERITLYPFLSSPLNRQHRRQFHLLLSHFIPLPLPLILVLTHERIHVLLQTLIDIDVNYLVPPRSNINNIHDGILNGIRRPFPVQPLSSARTIVVTLRTTTTTITVKKDGEKNRKRIIMKRMMRIVDFLRRMGVGVRLQVEGYWEEEEVMAGEWEREWK